MKLTVGTRTSLTLALALLLAAPGCTGGASPVTPPRPTKKPATTRPVASPAVLGQLAALGALEKLVVPQTGQSATLTGKAKLFSDRSGAIISDNGGGIISDNGGGIISDNGGGIISNNAGAIIANNGGAVGADSNAEQRGGGLVANNGGGLVANNGGGLTGKAKFGLVQAPAAAQAPAGLALFRLADAVVTLHDARGRLLVDVQNQPLMATTDKEGGYTLRASLPPGNLVAKIRLWNGGELAAMVARDGDQLTIDLDTASTMGAAYVLGQFVKGDQAVFDKLPRSENERLTRELDVVRGYLKGAFKYDARLLTEATDALRTRVPAVDRTIEDVKALLLGQANLGGGRLATEVALADPIAITVRKSGAVLVAERFVGRVRAIDAAGKLSTLVDAAFGTFKANYPTLSEVIEGPDGALYLCAQRTGHVFRLDPSGKTEAIAGTGKQGRDQVGAALETPMVPRSLAFGADGTLYVGEVRGDGTSLKDIPPRVLAIKDGQATAVPGATWGQGNLQAIQIGPDGAFYVLHQVANGGRGTLFKLAQGVTTTIAADLGCEDDSDMVRGPDGTLYVAENLDGHLTAIAPDGTKRFLTGPGGTEASTAPIRVPCGLGIGPDGTLYVADQATSLVYARSPAGAWRVIAGTQAAHQQGDVTNFAISLPGGTAFSAENDLYIAEGGSHAIKRFRAGRLEIVAGGLRGYNGDGGPAAEARLSSPTGIAMREGALYVLDAGNRVMRRIAADGTITTIAGGRVVKKVITPGEAAPAATVSLGGGLGLKIAPDGRPYWSNQESAQVARLSTGPAGAVVESVLGPGSEDGPGGLDFGAILAASFDADPAKTHITFPFGIAFDAAGDLYVTDAVACQVLKVTRPGTPEARVEVWAGLTLGEVVAKGGEIGPTGAIGSEEGFDRKAIGAIVPTGLTFDKAGNLYLAEAGTLNLAAFGSVFGGRFPVEPSMLPQAPPRVRRITPDGKVTTIAGPGGKFFKDPQAEDALALPTSLEIDGAGRLVIIDSGANLIRILPAGSF